MNELAADFLNQCGAGGRTVREESLHANQTPMENSVKFRPSPCALTALAIAFATLAVALSGCESHQNGSGAAEQSATRQRVAPGGGELAWLGGEDGYEFRENLGRKILFQSPNGFFFIGYFDAPGNFVPREGAYHGPYSGSAEDVKAIAARKKTVYEFRSRMLVKGKLDDQWNFVPEIGSEVIRFEDYRYMRDTPIYNLPGEFVEKQPTTWRPKN